MRTIALIRADFMKQRHTPYFCIHSVIPVTGAILFVFYFLYYQNVDELKKICFLLELTAMVFPLLISIIVGLNIMQEEGLALSKSDDGTRAQEDTIGKVRCTVSVWSFLFSAAFYSVCDWGGNEPDRNDPLEVADAICAGISYE